jgi:hypothetical protein
MFIYECRLYSRGCQTKPNAKQRNAAPDDFCRARQNVPAPVLPSERHMSCPSKKVSKKERNKQRNKHKKYKLSSPHHCSSSHHSLPVKALFGTRPEKENMKVMDKELPE